MLTLVLMVALVGVVIWAAVTNQNVGLVETIDQPTMDLVSPSVVDGDRFNVVQHGLGEPQIVLLHDADIAGSTLWADVVENLGLEVTTVTIDLPGYGLSARYPEVGPAHTVSSMAGVVSTIVGERFPDRAVVFAGVGLGAEVAAEIAVTHPEQVSALVMIDADFYASDTVIESIEQWPFIGPAVMFAFDGGGAWYERNWAPNCADGGWCPSNQQVAARTQATKLIGTNESLRSFLRTPASSLVPSLLDEIDAPSTFIWSTDGPVSDDSVQSVVDAISGLEVIEVDAWKAHLDQPEAVAAAILASGSNS